MIAVSLASASSTAQVHGPVYRQFFYNPYLFNPAFVGINKRTEANVVYRQQWTNFKDAPVSAGVNLQIPTGKRIALGFAVASEKQVLIRKSTFMATFGYVVPMADNQSLRFGLSGGVGLNKLDLTSEELNTNDPALVNTRNNFFADGNFGAVYTNGGLKLGFAIVDIFQSTSFVGENSNQFEFSHLKNRLYSVSYRFPLGVTHDIFLEPYFLYRETEDGLQNAWEGSVLLYFKDKLWTGGSYHENNGIALFLGATIKDKFKFSYSYDFPPFRSGFTSSSHELHVGIFLSREKPVDDGESYNAIYVR